jgi:uncharacterized protein YbjQ (UPF0145 family)
MEFLTRPCLKCHNPMNGGVYRAAQFCPHCFFEHEGGRKKRRGKVTAVASDADTLRTQAVKTAAAMEASTVEASSGEAGTAGTSTVETSTARAAAGAIPATAGTMQVEEIYDAEEEVAAAEPPPRQAITVVLTTKSLSEQTVLESLDEVIAECVLNLKVTPDLISNGKFVGTKSEKVKAALEQGKKHVLTQLRQKAQERGANIVADVSVKNAVKITDSQTVRIIVKAAGQAAIVEMAAETSEA